MKITINNGVVVATSETKDEALALVSMSLGNVTNDTPQEEKSETKRHYIVKKPCEICGEKFKGARAMALHKSMKHGIRSPKYEENKKYWNKVKQEEGLLGIVTDTRA